MSRSIAFIPGSHASGVEPLARYLPPLPRGIVASWLVANVPAGSWLVDPFGASPALAVEAARAGYRLLVPANNPVAKFLIETAANPPSPAELRAALAELAAARIGDSRLEPYILSLYLTDCRECRREIPAESFVWMKSATAPSAVIYQCPHCGDHGERPASTQDAERAAKFSTSGLHWARAIERVTSLHDPDRVHTEEALTVYLPRAVYALFTIINKLASLPSPPGSNRRRHLDLLLLSACDEANTLWQHPSGRARPRQLTTSTRFREKNIWYSLEAAVNSLAVEVDSPLPVTLWPTEPPASRGIMIFEGRLKDLADVLPETRDKKLEILAAVGAFPRTNQAFWTLSALWAGWLWGREAAKPFKGVLRRRRYDWSWHTIALNYGLSSLGKLIPLGAPFFGLIGEVEPGFLSATVIAAAAAGFELRGMAMRVESGQAQLLWERASPGKAQIPTQGSTDYQPLDGLKQAASEAGRQYLTERGEPSPYLDLHGAALSTLAPTTKTLLEASNKPGEMYNQIQDTLDESFAYREGFLRYGGSDKSLEVGLWWLRDASISNAPLADKVELAILEYFLAHPSMARVELERHVCSLFQGLFTPEEDLILACLNSYGQPDEAVAEQWRLFPTELTEVRQEEISEIQAVLREIGENLGFKTSGGNPFTWEDKNSRKMYTFYILVTAAFGATVLDVNAPPGEKFIVLPGGRAALALHKLRKNPYLEQQFASGWHFLKFRHVRRLAELDTLDRENLEENLALDPLTDTAPQMRFL